MAQAVTTFSRTDLTRKTRKILELVRQGRPALIQSYGEEQAILLDPLDYRLLQGFAGLAFDSADEGTEIQGLLRRYLDDEISLTNVAKTLGVSRFDLLERFERLGVPLQIGPEDLREAREEAAAARALR